MSKITGLIPAVFSPFHSDGSLNLGMIEKQAEALIGDGIQGAFVCGTTGESLSLTIDERKAIAQRWVDITPQNFKIIVHTGHNSMYEAIELSRHAQEIGAWGTAAMPSNFLRPANVKALTAFCKQLADAAPDLPFYYYHIPPMTGVCLPMRHFMKQAIARIPNFSGIKYSDGDLLDMGLCVQEAKGEYDIMFGKDEILLAAMALGVRAAVGSTYNYMAPVYQKVIKLFRENKMEEALEEQRKAMTLVEVLDEFGGGIIFGKAIMRMKGIDCGPVRLPLTNLTHEQLRAIEKRLVEIGFDTL